jgi:hypothetical protein
VLLGHDPFALILADRERRNAALRLVGDSQPLDP